VKSISSLLFSDLLVDPAVYVGLSDVEVSMLSALSCRYNSVADTTPADALITANTAEYSTALQQVYTRYPTQACIAALYAESLMNFSPWHLWSLDTGQPTHHAKAAQDVLSRAMRLHPHHPGLNHFSVHLMEMSPTPRAALPSCDVLRFYFPDAGSSLLINVPGS
jgi:hypothetical protein